MDNTPGSDRAGQLKRIAGVILVSLVVAACGSDSDSADAEVANGSVQLVMAPDPVWKWLEDTGIKQEMEEKAGIQILASSSWDEFGVYAGGHADVISAASYEVPDLEKATGEPATIFGKYNSDRSIVAVAESSPYQDLCALKGKKIATFTAVSVTLIWGMYARELCDLDLRVGGGDYEIVVADIQQLSSLVARGDADACLCIPDFAIPELASGTLRPIYDGKSASQMFAENFSSNPEALSHPQTNVFVARKAWVEKNPKEARFIIALWDRGIKEWQANRDAIIDAYPEDFAVRNPEESKFIKDWLSNRFDWFVPTAFLDEAWISEETEVFDLMKKSGFMEEDVPTPHFTVLEPTS